LQVSFLCSFFLKNEGFKNFLSCLRNEISNHSNAPIISGPNLSTDWKQISLRQAIKEAKRDRMEEWFDQGKVEVSILDKSELRQ